MHRDDPAALAALMARLDSMPPVAAMALAGVDFDRGNGRMRLRAPLAANVNDKGCAFGGSMNSLMTLAGWALVTQLLAAAGQAADVYVQDSTIRYLAPLYGELVAEAWLAPGQDPAALAAAFAQRGRARAAVQARIVGGDGGGEAAVLEARFVAKRPVAA